MVLLQVRSSHTGGNKLISEIVYVCVEGGRGRYENGYPEVLLNYTCLPCTTCTLILVARTTNNHD